ncbi:MAG: hypothetical protein ACFHHU_07480 [Porticoccaceae bacterium]
MCSFDQWGVATRQRLSVRD